MNYGTCLRSGAARSLKIATYLHAFDVAGDEVYFAPFGSCGTTISAYDLRTGPTRHAFTISANQATPSFAVAPDRKTVLYQLSEQAGADLMLVEPFRQQPLRGSRTGFFTAFVTRYSPGVPTRDSRGSRTGFSDGVLAGRDEPRVDADGKAI